MQSLGKHSGIIEYKPGNIAFSIFLSPANEFQNEYQLVTNCSPWRHVISYRNYKDSFLGI